MTERRATIQSDYAPNSIQKRIHQALLVARFVVAMVGRRGGKSYAALHECQRRALSKPDQAIRWVSPVFAQSRARYREFGKILREIPKKVVAKTNMTELRVEFTNGSEIKFVSAFDADNLRGEGAHFLVVDEAGYIDADVWTHVLRPMLAETQGSALLIGTPKGRHQFLYQKYAMGIAGEPGWYGIQAPTSENERIPAEEIEAAKRELPEDVYRQEYEAIALASSAGVFPTVDQCIRGALSEPVPGRRYVVGADLAQRVDYSVFLVMDVESRQVVHFVRIQNEDYVSQSNRIAALAYHYGSADIVIDETGIGIAILDNLRSILGRRRDQQDVDRRGGLRKRAPEVVGVVLTNERKQDLVDRLRVSIERRQVGIPESCEVLLSEMRIFGYEMLPSGRVRYTAPSGYHDDAVIALALANFATPRELSIDAVDSRLRAIIEECKPHVENARRYGLAPEKRVGWVLADPLVPKPEPNLHSEYLLLAAACEANLITEAEGDLLADDLRRRIQREPFWRGADYADQPRADIQVVPWNTFVSTGQWRPTKGETEK